MIGRLAVVLVLGIAPLRVSLAAQDSRSTGVDPATATLKLADLPDGFTLRSDEINENAGLIGHTVVFARLGGGVPTVIANTVLVSLTGEPLPDDALDEAVRGLLSVEGLADAVLLDGAGAGDATRWLGKTMPDSEIVFVVFARGNGLAVVSMQSGGGVNQQELLQLATIVSERMVPTTAPVVSPPPPAIATPPPAEPAAAGSQAQDGNAPQPPPPGTILLADDFDDERNGWLPRSEPAGETFQVGYEAGEYRIAVPAGSGSAVSPPIPGEYGDVSIQVDARMVGDAGQAAVGVACRAAASPDGSVNNYRLVVQPASRSYTLQRADAGVATDLVAWTPSLAIQRGDTWNRLALFCVGDQITANINGVEVASVTDASYGAGAVAFGFLPEPGVGGEAHIDNLIVTQE